MIAEIKTLDYGQPSCNTEYGMEQKNSLKP